jgi:MFS family permease
MCQVMVTVGIFLVNLVGYAFVTYCNHGWRYVQLIAIIPCVMTFLYKHMIYESPAWLVRHDRADEALEVLSCLRPKGFNAQVSREDALVYLNAGYLACQIYLFTYAYVGIMCLYLSIYLCMYLCTYTHTNTYINIHTCKCVCICHFNCVCRPN